MKLYYFNLVDFECSIFSKIKNQANVFMKYKSEGLLEDFFCIHEVKRQKNCVFFDTGSKKVKIKDPNTKFDMIYNWIYAVPNLYEAAFIYILNNHYTHIYIRRSEFLDYFFIRFLRKLKKHNIIIMFEIPTFPYDMEFRKDSFLAKQEKIYRVYLKEYVNIIITPALVPKIFGISTLYVPNGIIVDDTIPLKTTIPDDYSIHLIAVAGLSEWHGYDRLLNGLAIYYHNGGKRNIVFHMVGGGKNNPVHLQYEKIVEEEVLKDHVVFYGNQHGDALDQIYNKCSIGIASLGMHRINIFLASTLKSREYAAKGLPMLTSCKIDIFPDNYPYIQRIPADESPVDVEQLIDFHDQLYKRDEDYEKVAKTIRQYAKDHCDMKFTMKPVIDYIMEEKE